MYVFVVWTRVEYSLPKRGRVRSREPKRREVVQTKRQRQTLMDLGAAKWDAENRDYVIYRISVGKDPSDSVLSGIREACETVGLSGPFWGEGQIGWLGTGGGPEKHVNAKIARQVAEKFIREKCDILMQIRNIAGFDCFTQIETLPDVSQEMRERWSYLGTSELDCWMEYLARKGGENYNKASALVSNDSQKEAFFGDTENPLHFLFKDIPRNKKTGKLEFNVTPFRETGRMMLQSELDSIQACVADASLLVQTEFASKPESAKKEISGTELGTVVINGRAWDNVIWGS